MSLPVRRSTTQPDRWRPFRELDDLYSELDRLMQSALGATAEATLMPSADVVETKDGYEVEIELPGVRREDIDVELIGNELAVTGEFKERKREGLFRRRTRRVGNFDYRVTLPGEIRDSDVTASLANGVLTIAVPKARSQSTKVKITESGNESR